MLTDLEHGRGPSAPSGSAVGIVDATPGPPGVAELPVAGVPLTPLTTPSLPGSVTAPVQREVRFDPAGRTALQTALSAAGDPVCTRQPAGPLVGAPTVVQRSESSTSPVTLPTPPAPSAPAAAGVPPAGSVSSGSSVPTSTGPTPGGPAVGDTGSPAPAAVAQAVDGPPVAQRSVADPDPGGPVLGATPLPRTLAAATMLQRSVDALGRLLSRLPVLADTTPVRSFVTAPPPPTARPALPVVPVGDGVVQRAVGSTTDRPTSSVAGIVCCRRCGIRVDVRRRARPGCRVVDVARAGSFPSGTPSLPDAPDRAPLLADAPPALEVPGESNT